MRNVVYDYASVAIDVPEPYAHEIMDWGNIHVPQQDLYDKPGFGREDEMHITVLYGLHSDDHKEVKDIADFKPIHVKLGEIKVFDNNDKFDVVIVDVISPELHVANQKLKDNIDYTNRYTSYKPHVTIAYVKKGKGYKYCGSEKFKDIEFVADEIIFSPREGNKKKIPLK